MASELSIKIDFKVIESNDPKYLFVGDISKYGVAQNHPAYIRILPPGASEWITNGLLKNQFNVFHAQNLGLDCIIDGCDREYSDLEDGVWEICVETAFTDISKKKYYLKTDALRQEIDKLYIKAGLDYCESSVIIKELRKVEFFLSAANAYMKKGDHVKAKKAYDLSQKTTERISNCRDCY